MRTCTTYSLLLKLSLCSITRYCGGFFFFVSLLQMGSVPSSTQKRLGQMEEMQGLRYQHCWSCRGAVHATFRKTSTAQDQRQWSLTYRPGQVRRCPGGPAHCLLVDWFQQLAHARVACGGSVAATPDVLHYLQPHSNIVELPHDPDFDS